MCDVSLDLNLVPDSRSGPLRAQLATDRWMEEHLREWVEIRGLTVLKSHRPQTSEGNCSQLHRTPPSTRKIRVH